MKKIAHTRSKITSIAAVLIVLIQAAFPQQGRETLTNSKIIELVRLGLGESVIIEKIRQSECRCDTSTAELAKLKAARVSDGIIMAMMNPSSGGYSESGPPRTSVPTKGSPAVAIGDPESTALSNVSEPGIYLYEDGKLSGMDPSVFSGTKTSVFGWAMTGGIAKSKVRAKIPRSSANTQPSSRTPIFYFIFNPEIKATGAVMSGSIWGLPATSPAEFLMVQMQVKGGSREAVVGEAGLFSGINSGARDRDMREYSFEKIRLGVFKVVPKGALPPGEYAFYYAGTVSGLISGGKIFDFSVK